MKIIYSKSKNPSSNYSYKIGKSNFNIFLNHSSVEINIDNIKLFLEGEFYYSIIKGKFEKITKSNLISVIKSLVRDYGVINLPEHLEGAYLYCWFDQVTLKCGFSGDVLNTKKAYYKKENNELIISSNLKDLVSGDTKFDQLSLYSYMLIGYPAVNDTFYDGIKKIGNDEYFLFTPEGFQKNKILSSPKKIEAFTKNNLNDYDNIFENSVSSRAASNNVVMNSGGWDSTSIVYKLTKTQIKDSVSAVVFDVKLSDGQNYNSYEVL